MINGQTGILKKIHCISETGFGLLAIKRCWFFIAVFFLMVKCRRLMRSV
jgi:hypothetical protein